MMKKIFKYRIEIGQNWIDVPEGGTPMHVAFKDDGLYVWILVEDNPPSKMCINVYATGQEFDDFGQWYLGTVHMDWTVWHVWHQM